MADHTPTSTPNPRSPGAGRPERLLLRAMTPVDLEQADALRKLAGWNQTRTDWQRFMNCAPGGCFVAHRDGVLAGTATTIRYGRELGWIGMLLVHPDQRRGGIGAALLEGCIEHLKTEGVRSIKLDATPLGKPLYERHGFQTELSLNRWETAGVDLRVPAAASEPLSGTEADLEAIAALDEKAFGLSRRLLLGELLKQAPHMIIHRSPGQAVQGYGMLRAGARASYLGPVVATGATTGEQIVRDLLARVPGNPVYWDILDGNPSARALAQSLGFTPQRTLVRMFLGENFANPNPGLQWAIIDPAVG